MMLRLQKPCLYSQRRAEYRGGARRNSRLARAMQTRNRLQQMSGGMMGLQR
jgi:hypothetical protein